MGETSISHISHAVSPRWYICLPFQLGFSLLHILIEKKKKKTPINEVYLTKGQTRISHFPFITTSDIILILCSSLALQWSLPAWGRESLALHTHESQTATALRLTPGPLQITKLRPQIIFLKFAFMKMWSYFIFLCRRTLLIVPEIQVSNADMKKRLLKYNSCNTCNYKHDAYQYHLCNGYLWIPVDNNAKMWVRNALLSSYSPYLPQSMSGEDLVCIIFCYGLCHENEASGNSFPSEEGKRGRSRNWILQTIFSTLDGTCWYYYEYFIIECRLQNKYIYIYFFFKEMCMLKMFMSKILCQLHM